VLRRRSSDTVSSLRRGRGSGSSAAVRVATAVDAAVEDGGGGASIDLPVGVGTVADGAPVHAVTSPPASTTVMHRTDAAITLTVNPIPASARNSPRFGDPRWPPYERAERGYRLTVGDESDTP